VPRPFTMSPLSDTELATRLLTAAVLGGILGLERELRQKSAGLRTNMLIAIGSALFTLMSYELAEGPAADPSRVAAQIVTGIGFLGAGAIMRTGGNVQGLTTAATVWVNAAVGVAAGGGEYHLAFIATAVTFVVLLLLEPIERILARKIAKADESHEES
jgi:putative Mg2+ transporter-C (MgtC) family protein